MLEKSRETVAKEIATKIKAGEALTQEEADYACKSLEDPLKEVCIRQALRFMVCVLNINNVEDAVMLKAAEKMEGLISTTMRDFASGVATMFGYTHKAVMDSMIEVELENKRKEEK